MSKKQTIQQAAKALEKSLIDNGYTVDALANNGAEYQAITASLELIHVKRVGNKGGYWIDTATGMPVVPVWFK